MSTTTRTLVRGLVQSGIVIFHHEVTITAFPSCSTSKYGGLHVYPLSSLLLADGLDSGRIQSPEHPPDAHFEVSNIMW